MTQPDHVESTRAVYDASAALYADRIGTTINSAIETPFDQALLDRFVDLVHRAPSGVVADLGCGPGRVAALLASAGVPVVGIDLSMAMLVAGRSAHPTIGFAEGTLTNLPIADHSLVGAVYWYSIIHTPPAGLPAVSEELSRVLRPASPALLAFQAGDAERTDRPDAYGGAHTLTSYRHSPDEVETHLRDAGFTVHERVERRAEHDHESTPQGFLVARAAGIRSPASD